MSTLPLDVLGCELSGIINVEASAGTGKTWNICWLFLRLLLEQGRKPSEILVVTFTEAATAELRERIRTRLAEVHRALALGFNDDQFIQKLIEHSIDGAGLSREAAKNLLETALQSFDEASIFTIHGFCHRALSEAAFAAGQPFASEVLRSGDEFIERVAQDFWRREILTRGGDEIRVILGYPKSRLKKSNSGGTPALSLEGLAATLKGVVGKPLSKHRWPEAPAPVDETELYSAMQQGLLAWRAQSADALSRLQASIEAGDLKAPYKGAEGTIRLVKARLAWEKILLQHDLDQELLESAKLLTASAIKKGTYARKTPLTAELFDILQTVCLLLEQKMAGWKQQRSALLRQFVEQGPLALAEEKRRARILTFDDMLCNLHAALDGAKAVAGFADILRKRFPCALIDEFQDTDPLQLEIFRKIYAKGGPIFLVGDPKQAIYSFRGADLHCYLSARADAGQRYTLTHNQRSTPEMLKALNRLFQANDRPFRVEGLDFNPALPGNKPITALVDKTGVNRAALSVWYLQGGSKTQPLLAKQAHQQILSATVDEIVRLLRAGRDRLILIGNRPLAPRDIALLVRTHKQGKEIKAALSAAGVNAVELSQSDVFDSFEALEMEQILQAVADPANTGTLRGALTTVLLGINASTLATLKENELGAWTDRFIHYKEVWQKQGFGRFWREMLTQEHLVERVLPLPGGERRASNLSHLAEILSAEAYSRPGIEVLLKWFAETRRSSGEGNDEQQLRLESDENLVQIVTKHRCKGLEYPIVFCPFIWNDGKAPPQQHFSYHYHDPESGKTLFDFSLADKAKEAQQRELAEERLRVIYVALTRAVYRCYIAGGTFFEGNGPSAKKSSRAALNWLAGGQGIEVQTWDQGEASQAAIEAGWEGLLSCSDIGFLGFEKPLSRTFLAAATQRAEFQAEVLPSACIPSPAWRLDSYSGLKRSQKGEYVVSDHDSGEELPLYSETPAASVESVAATDIFCFERSRRAGECVHAIFEKANLTKPESWQPVIDAALRRFLPHPAEQASAQLASMLKDVVDSTLPAGMLLKTIPPPRRLTELEFHFTVGKVKANQLFELLEAHGWQGQQVSFGELHGFLRGSIDFICEYLGKWYLIDWKSNYLGNRQADYAPSRVAEDVHDNSYDFQALIYLLALHRYLGLRLGRTYDCATHLGGALYLYVRGVRPAWQDAGIWHWQPSVALITALENLLCVASSGVLHE